MDSSNENTLSVIELITQDEVDPRFESINEETDRLKKGARDGTVCRTFRSIYTRFLCGKSTIT